MTTLPLTPRLAEWRISGKTFRHSGHEIFYCDQGSGPALFLIHGFPTASWDWHLLWDHLVNHYRVVAPDLIGFGFSDKPSGYSYSTFDQADLVQGLAGELAIDKALVLAHDYGDTVVQELLARQKLRDAPLQITAAALLNGGLFPEAVHPRPIQNLMLTPLAPLIGMIFGRRLFGLSFSALFAEPGRPAAVELDEFWSLIRYNRGKKALRRIIRYIGERERHRERWVGALQQSPVPLQFVCGLGDPVSGRDMASRFRELVPDGALVELNGVGHYPQIEAPDQVLAATAPFLASGP